MADPNNNDSGDDASPDSDLSLTKSVKEFIKAAHHHTCSLCGADGTHDEVSLHVHHRVRRADGGSNHPENLTVLCSDCHNRHHGAAIPITSQRSSNQHSDSSAEQEPMAHDTPDPNDEPNTERNSPTQTDPLPPRQTPNGTDKDIIDCVEQHGPVSVADIADCVDISEEYARRELWKLAGENIIANRSDGYWDIPERTPDSKREVGLPENPKAAQRAGRDEVIRQMAADGMSREQIKRITDLSRSTVDKAVFRARARQATDLAFTDDADISAVTDQLSLVLEWLGQIEQEAKSADD